ncbi:conserved hypothetical protein [Culex quinquefasciatus]|uniref:DUF4746 domain-containing protein n=1 Tax=Culex quinquefasciatus TaxID=7176 RepID=B0WTM5_CULQU|nr:uncharacterized protein LOC120423756 [Culex pipiens pallens]EDS34478.1 conserved hypothetical protein [Culex quinquefasciatus]|eukprot:XP_001854896.1 conserved hypothetical protein [Culex quinquefasciatus]
MAKKGGVQQLQAEINTDEEFEKFLERDGLLVMDIYTDWCGPCTGMVSSLKKIKLELGGDNLQLAVCKSDDIEALKRFRNNSEPTWLFASHAKIVNLMYGTNVPKLINMITEELDIELKCRAGEVERKYYELHELTPEEQEREDAKRAIEENAERIEKEAAIKKRRDYIIHVFDEIMTNIPDMGITLFMPHVHKDVYKKMNENAEKHDLHFKEKRLVHLNPKMLEVLHFDCENPIEDDIFEHIFYKDVQAYVWKLQEDVSRTPEDVIADFVQFLTEPSEVLDADGNVEKVIPPLIEPLEMHYNQNDGTWKPLIKNPPKKGAKGAKPTPELAAATTSSASMSSSKETFDEESCPKMFIPGIWSPTNRRATAALFYLLFRHLTDHFLPPDPVPEPPHICIVFDAYKKRDVFEVAEKYKRDVISYGFFTTGDPKTAELIAKTTERYVRLKPNVNDKLILKCSKATSHAMLALTAVGPCYISQNAVEGQEECALLFPPNYNNIEEDVEIEADTKKKHKKKRRGKKSDTSVSTADSGTSSTPTADGQGEGGELGTVGEGSNGEEGETTSSSTNSPEKTADDGEEAKG